MSGISTTHLYPGVKDVVLRLDRVHVLAVVKVIDCYHNNRRCIKRRGKVKNLLRKNNMQKLTQNMKPSNFPRYFLLKSVWINFIFELHLHLVFRCCCFVLFCFFHYRIGCDNVFFFV